MNLEEHAAKALVLETSGRADSPWSRLQNAGRGGCCRGRHWSLRDQGAGSDRKARQIGRHQNGGHTSLKQKRGARRFLGCQLPAIPLRACL